MCGVVGLVGPLADTTEGRAWVEAALDTIAVRGPDARTLWQDRGVILGHRRLSIRDLSETGAQPMHRPSGEASIVYNGEIYDTNPLADRLAKQGFRARGHSDTELVLEHLGRAWDRAGIDAACAALRDFNGMFALGLWHPRTRTLLLARDRLGIKPLYVAHTPDGLAFCSEPAPLYRLPGVDRTLDPDALSLYLTLGEVPSPYSMARGVRQLLPGEAMLVTEGHAPTTRRALTLPEPARPGVRPANPTTEAELESLLVAVVSDQLVSDVPVGVLLSGGVDSSVVAAAASRAGGTIKTFSIVHQNPDYDERHSSRAVARHLGSEHHELELQPGGLTRDELDTLITRTGDPFGDSSALPMRRVSALVRQHVTVALSGDGGDELFAGYDRYSQAEQLLQISRLPRRVRRGIVRAWSRLDRTYAPPARQLRVRQLARACAVTLRTTGEQGFGSKTFMWPDEVAARVQPHARSTLTVDDFVRARLGRVPPRIDAWTMHALEQHSVLPDQMLVKVDRMSMTESLEIRPCLLDNRILDAAARTPFADKFQPGEGKAILKRIARRWVPPEVVDRPKKGFSVPLIDYGGQVLVEAGRWALQSQQSPLARVFTDAARRELFDELHRPPPGRSPEDSPYRLHHRRWILVQLAMGLQRLDVDLG